MARAQDRCYERTNQRTKSMVATSDAIVLTIASIGSVLLLLRAHVRAWPRNACILRVRHRGAARGSTRLVNVQGRLSMSSVLTALHASGIDTQRWRPLWWDSVEGGWAELSAIERVAAHDARELLIELEDSLKSEHWADHPNGHAASGFFGIGIVLGKTAGNVGTLWRSAYQLGAAFTATIGARHTSLKEDTAKCWQSLPAHQYTDFASFAATAPYACQLVAIEMGGRDLRTFVHPPRAVYLLGAEDIGLPSEVLRACHHHISLPAERSASYNVAVAGSLVMFDRLCKQRAPQPTDDAVPPSTPKTTLEGSRPSADTTHVPQETADADASALGAARGTADAQVGAPSVSDLAEWWHARPPADCVPLLMVRCARAFKSRVIEYLDEAMGCELRAATPEWLVCRCADVDAALRRLRIDRSASRAIEGAYAAEWWAADLKDVCTRVEALAAGRSLRLSVCPRQLQPLLETALPSSVHLTPTSHEAILYVLQPTTPGFWCALRPAVSPPARAPAAANAADATYDVCDAHRPARHDTPTAAPARHDVFTEAHARMAFRMHAPALVVHDGRRALPAAFSELPSEACSTLIPTGKALQLEGAAAGTMSAGAADAADALAVRTYATVAVHLAVDLERLLPLLTHRLPPLLQRGASVAVVVSLPREGARGARAAAALVAKLTLSLVDAGYSAVDVRWLFANGPTERTLCCQWRGRVVTSM